jgi:hypothetical protein
MDLPTITEEDGDSVVSGSTEKSSKNNEDNLVGAMSTGGTPSVGSKDIEKKKKKRAKGKDADHSADYDTAQQILVDLCTEMKDLKKSMQEGQKMASDNLESNQHVVARLADQMEMLRGNMKQLDQVIESKATPKQIEDMGRIRAVQEIVKAVSDDKERTVLVYEEHARRGYEEIERLRRDLVDERGEVAALRAELEVVRGDRQRMLASGPSPTNGLNPANIYINAGDSVGFDDMTLNTKESYETSAYETKSLKKRIIHMKKKLTVAQLEAQETGKLRLEVEKLRVQCETEKKASQVKDDTIKRLENQVKELICNPNFAPLESTTAPGTSPPPPKSAAVTPEPLPPKPVVKNTRNARKWWDI